MRRYVRPAVGEPRRWLETMLAQDFAKRVPGKRWFSGKTFIRHDRHRVLVGPSCQRLTVQLLRRHVRRRPHRPTRLRQLHRAERLRHSEVANHRPTVLVNHHVCRLHVTVDDPPVVGVVQGTGYLLHQSQTLHQVEGPTIGDQFRQRVAPDKFHGKPEESGAAANLVNRHNVGMVERRGDLGLSFEPLG